jgi:hypothetical protein
MFIALNFLLIASGIILYLHVYKKEEKKYFFFWELIIAIYIVSYTFYNLLAYRTHHSYKNINEYFLIKANLNFLIFLTILFFFYIFKSYIYSFFKFNTHRIDAKEKNKIKNIDLLFILVGVIFFIINRTNILTCSNEDEFFLNKYIYLNNKLITITYFGIYLYIAGILLYFYNRILFSAKKIHLIIFYTFIIPFSTLLTVNQSGGSGIIIVIFILTTLVLFLKNKNIFSIQIIFFSFIIFLILTLKLSFREYISSNIKNCQYNILKNSQTVIKITSKFLLDELLTSSSSNPNIKPLTYMLEDGEFVDIKSAGRFRIRVANILERIDLSQMLAQNIYLREKEHLPLMLGRTYLDREINWKSEYGLKLKQTNGSLDSAFNMPKLNESYFNFGTTGILLFSIFFSIFLLLINFFINNYRLNTDQKILVIVIFSHFLIPENDLIYATKNSFYTALIIIPAYILSSKFLKKFNN